MVVLGLAGTFRLGWPWYSLVPLIVLGMALVCWEQRLDTLSRQRRLKTTTAGRESLGPEAFAERFFAPRYRPVAVEVVRVLEGIGEIDWGCVGPDDDFAKDLALAEGDVMLARLELCRTFRSSFSKVEIERLPTTIRAIVHCICDRDPAA